MPKRRADARKSPLPPLHARWMGELLAGPIPPETEATCDDCAMCAKGGAPRGDTHFFRPDVKCCSYVPELPNFLVGRILADKDPALAAGRKSVATRIQAGVGVTPLGLGQPPVYRVLYEQGAPRAFGQSQALRCPHFLDDGVGRCAIWRHRNSVCTTWFCKHVRGAVGARFWRSLNQLLGAVEVALARWCVLEIGLGGEALQRLFPPPGTRDQGGHLDADALDGVANAAQSRAVWGAWWGRERDLCRESARLVDGLTWERVIAIGGPEVRIFARTTHEAYRALASSELPDRLSPGRSTRHPLVRGRHGLRPTAATTPWRSPRPSWTCSPTSTADPRETPSGRSSGGRGGCWTRPWCAGWPTSRSSSRPRRRLLPDLEPGRCAPLHPRGIRRPDRPSDVSRTFRVLPR